MIKIIRSVCVKFSLGMALLFFMNLGFSQDVEKIVKGEKIKLSGSVSALQSYNVAVGKVASRKPYNYLLTGNLNLTLFEEFQLPVSFLYSNAGSAFSQPTFNQTSFHPKYKWFQAHVGTISVSHSPYTMGGHVFKGAAVDLTPGKWKFGGFYGRFQKAVNDTQVQSNNQIVFPAYERLGGGGNLGITGKKVSIETNALYAWDKTTGIAAPVFFTGITPKKNFAYGLKTSLLIFKKIKWMSDISTSFFTQDSRDKSKIIYALPLEVYELKGNASTAFYKALKQSLQYASSKGLQLSVNYEKIDPEYRTLGAYYFNNDMENITAGFGFNAFKSKLIFNGQLGKQRDNLNHKKASELTRTVGNANLSLALKKGMNMNLNYSNFLSYTNLRPYTDYLRTNPEYLALDTLNFRQISQQIGFVFSAKLGNNKTRNQNINVQITYQNAADKTGNQLSNGTAFYNAGLGYSFAHTASGSSLSFSLNAAQNEAANYIVQSLSPVLSFSKPLFKKAARFQISACQTQNFVKGLNSGTVFNCRSGFTYTYERMHNFSINATFIHRKDIQPENPAYGIRKFHEYCISLQYSANLSIFSSAKKNKK